MTRRPTALLLVAALGAAAVVVAGAGFGVVVVILVVVWLRVAGAAEARAREAVAASERFHRKVLVHAPGEAIVLEADGTMRFAAGRGEHETGTFPDIVHAGDRARAERLLEAATSNPSGIVREELRLLRGGSDGVWHEAIVTDLRDDPDIRGLVVNVRDITERRGYEQQLVRQALHDSLTGLPNRILLLDRVEQAITRVRRTGRASAVLFCDLDRFKAVNDSLGHEAGDELLRAVAARLVGAVREQDTVARLGGDEFAVLLGTVAGAGEALAVASRVAAAVQVPLQVAGCTVVPRISIGVALGDDARDAEDLMRNADLAMYEAKGRGGGVEQFTGCLHAARSTRLQLEADLRAALGRGELSVHYQPMFTLDDQRISGVEALLRWTHPVHGQVSPVDFVPIAEEAGIIREIGSWVLRTACAQAAAWQRDQGTPLSVAVNISPTQLLADDIVPLVRDALAGAGLAASDLVLEITEAVLISDADSVVTRLHELKALGVRIAIDDFGTGYSSLSYLRRLPVDVMKIDRSFVGSIAGSARDRSLAASVVDLGLALDLELVAEGIERADQLAWFTDHGCTVGQGFYLARPMAAEHVTELLTAAIPSPRVPADRLIHQSR